MFTILHWSENIALLFLRHSEENGKKNSKIFNKDKECGLKGMSPYSTGGWTL
jgi:hypothetical protein